MQGDLFGRALPIADLFATLASRSTPASVEHSQPVAQDAPHVDLTRAA
jgi:hypothetical protein